MHEPKVWSRRHLGLELAADGVAQVGQDWIVRPFSGSPPNTRLRHRSENYSSTAVVSLVADVNIG